MKNKTDYGGYNEDSYSKDTFDVDEDSLFDTDIKINPSFYIHINLLKAQDALVKDEMKDGLMQYCLCCEHMMMITESANLLPSDFQTKVEKFIKDNKLNEANLPERVKVSNYKYKLCLQSVFGSGTVTGGLVVDPKKKGEQS